MADIKNPTYDVVDMDERGNRGEGVEYDSMYNVLQRDVRPQRGEVGEAKYECPAMTKENARYEANTVPDTTTTSNGKSFCMADTSCNKFTCVFATIAVLAIIITLICFAVLFVEIARLQNQTVQLPQQALTDNVISQLREQTNKFEKKTKHYKSEQQATGTKQLYSSAK